MPMRCTLQLFALLKFLNCQNDSPFLELIRKAFPSQSTVCLALKKNKFISNVFRWALFVDCEAHLDTQPQINLQRVFQERNSHFYSFGSQKCHLIVAMYKAAASFVRILLPYTVLFLCK